MDKFDLKNQPRLPTIVLIGLMGSGKSSVARALAARLRCHAIDTDTLIENATKMPISEIFSTLGEAEFRRIEREQLQAALEYSGVIATGGGIVTQPENRALLQSAAERGALVVYLRASASELAQRIRRQPGKRPLIDGNGLLNLRQTEMRVAELLSRRGPLYESVASLVVETGAPDASFVAAEIESTLRALNPLSEKTVH